MDKNGIKYNIVKTLPNGVRVGNIPGIKDKNKKPEPAWHGFPKASLLKTWSVQGNMFQV